MGTKAHLVAIEGLDGSGKGTQLDLLATRLRESGFSVSTAAFPSYDEGIVGRKVGEYLDGRLGRVPDERPWLPSLLFATDRFEHRERLVESLRSADFLLIDRYVASNIAFQAVRLEQPELEEFAAWLEELEFGIFELPRPRLQIYLRMPPETARELVLRKSKRSYTDRDMDLYERDLERQRRSAEIYEWLAQSSFGGPWSVLDAADPAGEPLTRQRVTADLEAVLRGLVADEPESVAPAR